MNQLKNKLILVLIAILAVLVVLCVYTGVLLRNAGSDEIDQITNRTNSTTDSTCTVGHNPTINTETQLRYILVIDSDSDSIENHSNHVAPKQKNDHADGCVVIWVNDSPMGHYFGGRKTFPMHLFLNSGKNGIRIEGKFSKELFIKVVAYDPIKEVEQKLGIDAQSENIVLQSSSVMDQKTVFFEFNANVRFKLNLEDLTSSPTVLNANKEKINRLLDHIYECLQKNDADGVSSLLLPKSSSLPLHLSIIDSIKRDTWDNSMRPIIANPKYVMTTKREDLKYIIGKYCVLLYSRIEDGDAEIFRFELDDPASMPICWSEFKLVCLDGIWRLL